MDFVDKLMYFDLRGWAEPIRMLYAVAGKELNDVRVSQDEWGSLKEDQPLGQLPVLETEDGKLCQTRTIIRYVAKRFGLSGESLWEETLHDLVVESMLDITKDVPPKIYHWKLLKMVPEPEDPEKAVKEVKEEIVQKLPYIQSIAEKRGKKFIVGDTIGLAEVLFYTSLDFMNLAFPDSKEFTPWIKSFVENMEADERMAKYLANRPASSFGV